MNRQGFQGRVVQLIQAIVTAAILLFPLASGAVATQVDVSGQVTVTKSGLVFNRATGTYDSAVTLTNSLMPVTGPVRLILPSVTPSSVTLGNATGITEEFQSYLDVDVPGGTLAPGQSVKAVLKFKNPQRVSFSFTTLVLANVDTGSGTNSVTEAIDADGGEIELPGIAILKIPPDAFAGPTAVHIEVISLPEVEALTSEVVPGAVLLPLPQLKIKLSSAPLQPIFLEMPYAGVGDVIQDGSRIEFVKKVIEYGDNQEQMDGIQTLGGAPCGVNNESVCVTLYPTQFDPVPNDPADPVLNISLVKLPATEVTSLFFKNVTDIQPAGPVLNNATNVVFSAKIKITKDFPFGPTGGGGLNSGFYLWRNNPAGPHMAADLAAATGTHVTTATVGEVVSPGPGQQSSDGTIQCANRVVQRGGGFRMWVQHNSGLRTGYMHLENNSNQVNTGAAVTQGKYIADSDSTGTCKPHLHLQNWVYSQEGLFELDPWPLVKNDLKLFFEDLQSSDSHAPGSAELQLWVEVNGRASYFADQSFVKNLPMSPIANGVEISYTSNPLNISSLWAALNPRPDNKVKVILKLVAPRLGNKEIKLAEWELKAQPISTTPSINVTSVQCINNGKDQNYPHFLNYTYTATGTVYGPLGSILLAVLVDLSGYSTYSLQCGTWTAAHVGATNMMGCENTTGNSSATSFSITGYNQGGTDPVSANTVDIRLVSSTLDSLLVVADRACPAN